jgi:hypothetical protein
VRHLTAGDAQAVPPGVEHRVVGDGLFRLVVDFLVPVLPAPGGQPAAGAEAGAGVDPDDNG